MPNTAADAAGPRRVIIACILLASMAVAAPLLPLRSALESFLAWIAQLGWLGPVLLAAAYTPACIFMIPGWILTIGAGFAFGLAEGLPAVSIGSVVGAAAAFLVGRTLARDWVAAKVAGSPKFRSLDRAVEKDGLKLVLLVRLSPVLPFNLLNYALGATSVRLRDFILGSWIGMLPGSLVYIYIGSTLSSLADLSTAPDAAGPMQKGLTVVGLTAAVVATALLTRMARQALSEVETQSPSSNEAASNA
jgi:uncharacterized membrane protein YdjX (TVP38/TMEM64 family)